jgi:DNA-3-methyladenine glycosylase II
MPRPATLTPRRHAQAIAELSDREPKLAAIVERWGAPKFTRRPRGFGPLAYIILEQQVSLASARAIWRRLCAAIDPLTPERLLERDAAALRELGVSRQKARYLHDLAAHVADGRLDLDRLPALPDDEVRGALMQVKGIGRWSADVYLLGPLRRPDIWPTGDLALQTATQQALNLRRHPDEKRMDKLARRWRPWRSVAARLMWLDYLSRRGRD